MNAKGLIKWALSYAIVNFDDFAEYLDMGDLTCPSKEEVQQLRDLIGRPSVAIFNDPSDTLLGKIIPQSVVIAPLTGKTEVIARCDIEVPLEDVPELTRQLQEISSNSE